MARIVFACLAALLLTQAPAEPSPEARAELARHQGVWRAVSFRREGEETAEDVVRAVTRTVDGDRVVWRRDGKSFSGSTVVLDPTVKPTTIDIHADGGPGRDKVVRGIYKLDGDRLTICTADPDQPRPTAFRADPGDRWTFMVFDRQKPEPKP